MDADERREEEEKSWLYRRDFPPSRLASLHALHRATRKAKEAGERFGRWAPRAVARLVVVVMFEEGARSQAAASKALPTSTQLQWPGRLGKPDVEFKENLKIYEIWA